MRDSGHDIRPIVRELRAYILENFLPGDPDESLRDDDLLLEGGIVDSGSVISVVSFLEDRYGIRVEDDDLVVENFATVERIATFVAAKQAGACASF
jgi:acyl carrier protein